MGGGPRSLPKEDVDARALFIQWLLGDLEGFLAIGSKHSRTEEWEETIFEYPGDMTEVANFIIGRRITHELYFCATPLKEPRRVKGNITRSYCLWADLDTCSPDLLRVQPTIVIQTSPGRTQAFWKLKNPEHADEVERVNKRIAYFHADEGCDKSGYDLTQYLRIPNTLNHKYTPELHDVTVQLFDRDLVYELSDFDVYPALLEEPVEGLTLPFPTDEEMEELGTAANFMESIRTSVNPRAWQLHETVPSTDWSKALWQLELMLFDAGATPQEVFLVVREAACNKYARDNHNEMLLWKDVLRAQDYTRNNSAALAADNADLDWYVADRPLLSQEERLIAELYNTIVDDYLAWGTSVGDAAPAYHVAGAFILLSTLVAGNVRLPTSHGAVLPNLWFMILADTTLTRKTTAMDMAMDIVVDIEAEAVAATDGSVEGLFQTVAMRPRKPSIFLRDEFSGLLASMNKKDHMAGMLEAFTKLYDGKYQKKVLSKSTIEVRDPILIMFVGGIRSRIYELLDYNHINSGFLPRFVIVTAESDTSRVRPLGPPTVKSLHERDDLVQRFRDLFTYYNPPMVPGQLVAQSWDVRLTPEAWMRYNKLEEIMTEIGVHSAMPELMTPMMIRLCTSGLKAAVLIAATRLDQEIVVTERDLIKAFYFVETWKTHAISVVANAGKSPEEKLTERIYNTILQADKEGVARSSIMRTYRLNAREANNYFETLEQRGLIRRDGKGHGNKYFTTRKRLIGERLDSE